MIYRSKITVSILAICLTLNLTGCTNSKLTENQNNAIEKKVKIMGFSQMGSEGAWRNANSESIKDSAKQSGYELKFEDAQQKQENQIRQIKGFILQKVDMIVFSPVCTDNWDSILQEAKEANIPVIVTDRGINVKDQSLYTTLIGSDFNEEGKKAANWLIENVKDSGKDINIYELQGKEGSAPAVERKKGFEEVLKSHPNFKIVKSKPADFTFAKGKEVMKEFIKDNPKECNVIFAHNDDMALGAIEALEEAGLKPGKDVIIISMDGIKKAFEAMKEGKLNCTVECSPLLGPQLMEAIDEIQEGKQVSKRILTKEDIFPAKTAEEELPNRKY